MTMMIRGIAAWLLAMVLLASAAHAHGGVGMVDKRCVLRIGPDIMFFTGYQPQNSRDEFCDDIPSTGQMVVALDMQEPELRDMLILDLRSSGPGEIPPARSRHNWARPLGFE